MNRKVTVRSTETAYTSMLREEAAGRVRVVREQFLPGGVIERTYTSAAVANPSIRIGKGFFQNALRDYSEWKLKWWRECIQNSVDAKATEIKLDVRPVPEGYAVSCEDNGSGMSEDTLLNKFLVLGESGKGQREGQIGGFGKAKELLILPWLGWRITSRNVSVSGSGTEYEVERISTPQVGTLIEVIMPSDQYTTANAAKEYLQRCLLPGIKFFVDGEQFKEKLNKGTEVKSLPFGTLYHNKSKTYGEAYVRVNGLYMFRTGGFDYKYGTIIAEIERDTLDLLTANRDGFVRWSDANAIHSFVETLHTEGARALQKKSALITDIWKGTGKISEREGLLDVLDTIGPLPPVKPDEALVITPDAIERLGDLLGQIVQGQAGTGGLRLTSASPEIVNVIASVPLLGQSSVESLAQQLVWQPDFMVKNEVEGFRVPPKFKPEKMTKKLVALATVWAEACRWVFIQLGARGTYGVGFCFSDTALAMHASVDDADWLLVGPIRGGGSEGDILSVGNENDLKAIYAMAIHEVTHMASGYRSHDASFAAALTFNMGRCIAGWPTMKKIAMAALGRVVPADEPGNEAWIAPPETARWDEPGPRIPKVPKAKAEVTQEQIKWAYALGVDWSMDKRNDTELAQGAASLFGKEAKVLIPHFKQGLNEARETEAQR